MNFMPDEDVNVAIGSVTSGSVVSSAEELVCFIAGVLLRFLLRVVNFYLLIFSRRCS